MIRQFAHKGLERFFMTGNTQGIQADHSARLRMILGLLDGVTNPYDMNFPGSNLHQLKGKMKGLWSITVSANWRVTFRFEDGDAYLVNYHDYH